MENQRTVHPHSKTGASNPVFPYFVLALALVVLGFWRIATTLPEREAAPDVHGAPAVSAAPSQPASGPRGADKPTASAVSAAPSQSASGPRSADKPPAPAVSRKEPAPAGPASVPAAPAASALDRYLASHVGREIPFLYKGQTRAVTLVAFTDDTVTIKTKRTLTLKRKDLSAEQLNLWK
ncbi:MAG: hypothetical protein ACI4Q3_09575 [Kiritimatiellia bacterium]